MIEDLEKVGGAGDVTADLCIVGAGAAGITLAHEWIGAGLSVCLLESGGAELEPMTQALADGVSVGHAMDLQAERCRVFGGTTAKWTGRSATLDPIDFEPRDWVDHSGWPIGLETIAPFYRRAQIYCGFEAPWLSDEAACARLRVSLPRFDEAKLGPFLWRSAPQGRRRYVHWGRRYRRALAASTNVRVLLHANLTAFETTPDGARVTALIARALSGAQRRVTARAFVLCCGGVENARLLLVGGVGDAHGQVGRFLMQHPRGKIAAVNLDQAGSERMQRLFNTFAPIEGVQYEIGFALSQAAQRAERLLNASAILRFEADPNSAWESAKALAQGLARARLPADAAAKVARAAAGAGEVAANALRLARNRHAVLRTSAVDLVIDIEQAPNRESRVTLAETRDALGMPRAQVDWRVGEPERRTALALALHLQTEFQRLELGRVEPEHWLSTTEPIQSAQLSATNHHIATTRMSRAPEEGVVDADCKVHGMDNLFVAGSSVFSTGGHANPTLSIVALAVRLSDHLRATLAPSVHARGAEGSPSRMKAMSGA